MPSSKLNFTLTGMYLVIAAFLIATQELVEESFITLIVWLPWTLCFAVFEYFHAEKFLLYVFALAPIALNAFLVCKIGSYSRRQI